MEKYEATRNEASEKEQYDAKKQESTEKVVDLAGELALDYFTAGQGSAIKNELENVPVVGGAVKEVWDGAVGAVSSVVKETPVGDVAKVADDIGVLDVAKQAKGLINLSNGGGGTAAPSGNISPTSSPTSAPTPTSGNINSSSTATPASDIPNKSNTTNPETMPDQSKPNNNNDIANDSNTENSSKDNGKESGSDTNDNNSSNELEEDSTNSESSSKNIFEDLIMKSVQRQMFFGVIGLFVITLFFVMIASAKDNANLALTNNSSMSHNSSVGSGTISPSTFSGGNANQLQLGQSLLSILGQEKIDAWNNQIKNDVANASSRSEAVALAGYDLIQGALNEGIVLPYFWGGGHGAIYDGVDSSIGSSKKITASGSTLQPAGSSMPYGYDCSGFVSWAIKNGGCSNFTALTTHGFKALPSKVNIDVSQAKAGDVVVSNSHIVLVINNTGTSLQVAEAKGARVGIVFSEYNYSYFSKYETIDMSVYYATYC